MEGHGTRPNLLQATQPEHDSKAEDRQADEERALRQPGGLDCISLDDKPMDKAQGNTATASANGTLMDDSASRVSAGFGFTGPLTVFFGGMWLISAWLFRKAARA